MISHLALIMDGNRRWAKKRGMFAWLGHRQGAQAVEMVTQYCLDQKIAYLSLYTFSLENFSRSSEEVSYLFGLIREATARADEFIKNGVKVRFVGDLSTLPEQTKADCDELMAKTAQGSNLTCSFLLCYGGQQEIVAAAQKMIDSKVSRIDIETFKENLWMGNIPNPDIIIRTGGVQRLSNFLLFQAAYAEIRFLDCLWPDLTIDLLDQTVQNCINAHKNFGA